MPVQVEQGCQQRIRYHFDQLSKAEEKVARYMLDHPKDIIQLSITQLAERVVCAEATIFRLCKRIGYEGYQALKIAMSADLVQPFETIHEAIKPEDDMITIAKKLTAAAAQTLNDTLQVLSETDLEKAVLKLASANRIEFYGNGGSGVIAQDAYHKFVRTGIPCIALTDSHLQIVSAGMLRPGDVLVGISHSGSNKDMVDAMKAAKDAGAYTIAVTDYSGSPITRVSDLVLFTSARETLYRPESMSSRIAQFNLLDTLFVGVSLRRHDQMDINISKVRQLIAMKRY